MSKFRILLLSALSAVIFCSPSFAAEKRGFRTIYTYMKQRNVDGLQKAKRQGLSLDATDSKGINSLCYAIYEKDYEGYEILKALKADTNPPCLKKMSPYYKQAFERNKLYSLDYASKYLYLQPTPKYTTIFNKTSLLVTAAAGVAIGVAGSGGGGGGSDGDGFVEGPVIQAGMFTPVKNENPALYDTQEYLEGNFNAMIHADAAYARGYTGYVVNRTEQIDENGNPTFNAEVTPEKIKVAVLDNGVLVDHPDLNANIARNDDGSIKGFNYNYGPCTSVNNATCYKYESGMLYFVNNGSEEIIGTIRPDTWNQYAARFDSSYVWDEYNPNPFTIDEKTGEISSHGTHVAGIIGAIKNGVESDGINMHGVAYNAEILPITYDFVGSNLGTIFERVKNENVNIVNMSVGISAETGYDASQTDILRNYLNDNSKNALIDVFNNGTAIVLAAGNDGHSESQLLAGLPSIMPEAEKLFINVVAVGPDKTIASYSNKCGSTAGWCIAAPGGSGEPNDYRDMIVSTGIPKNGQDYIAMSGTSQAAPVVSGSLALLKGAFPHLTTQQAVQILFETADSLGDSSIYGHGLLNLDKATSPVGLPQIPLGESTLSNHIALNNSRINIPEAWAASLQDNLPEKMIFLDKYSRAYPLQTKSLFNFSDNDKKELNDLKRFINNGKKQTAKLDNKLTMSFSERVTESNDDSPLGYMDFSYQTDNDLLLNFFFTENTGFEHGNYFSKTLANPFLNMSDALGIKAQYELNDALDFNVAVYSGKNGFFSDDYRLQSQNDNTFNAIDYALKFSPTDYLSIGLKSGFLREDGSVLGMTGSGAFDTGNTQTTYAGIELTMQPTDKVSVTTAYYQGHSKTDKRAASLASFSDITSESVSLDVGYKFDNENTLGLQVASPLSIKSGQLSLDIPTGRDPLADKIYREKYNINMEQEAKELDIGLYFNHETTDEQWFRAEIGARINPDHQDADTDYRIMLGFGTAF